MRQYLESAEREFQRALSSYDDLSKHAVECTYNVTEQLSRDIEDVLSNVRKCQNNVIKA